MRCRRAMYNNIAPRPRFFSSEVKKCPRAGPCTRAEGPRARPCTRAFFIRGRKKSEVEEAILLYLARRHPIFIINIPPREAISPLYSFQPCATVYMPCTHLNRVQPYICPVHPYICPQQPYICPQLAYMPCEYIYAQTTGHINGCTRFK